MTAVVPLLLLACRRDPVAVPSAAEAGSPVDGDAYVSASLGDASQLNPVLSNDSASNEIVSLVFNGLVKYDKDLKLVGDLAESFEVRRGGRELAFRLRPGLKWHDGAPVTSDDVRFTYEKLVDPDVHTPYAADYQRVERLETPDPLTVKVFYKEPFVPALESWGKGILPRHVYGEGDFNGHPANRAPVGCGAYRFVEWKVDEKIVLEANPGYYEGKPRISRYVFRVIPDQAVQFLELRNDSVDSMNLTPDQYKAYDAFFRRHARYRHQAFSYTYMGFNLRRPMFRDVRVRRAVAHAIDKREIIQGILLGIGRPATGPFPPQTWAFDETVEDFAFSPERAKALLEEAGWHDADGDGAREKDGVPLSFTLVTNQGNKLRELSAQIIQARLAKVGVRMGIRVIEWSAFLKNFIDTGDFDVALLAWNTGIDPDQYVIWHSSQQGPKKYNFVGYSNVEADRLWEEGRREFDAVRRRAVYRRLHRIIHDDVPLVFLYYPESLPVVHRRFVGVEEAPIGIGWNFHKWFVPKVSQKYLDQ